MFNLLMKRNWECLTDLVTDIFNSHLSDVQESLGAWNQTGPRLGPPFKSWVPGAAA